jgi:hypothetical protein
MRSGMRIMPERVSGNSRAALTERQSTGILRFISLSGICTLRRREDKMFHRTILLVVPGIALGCCLIAATWAEERKPVAQDEIKELMIQRRDVLKQRVAAVDEQFRVGRTALGELVAAQNDLLTAELELAESKTKRVALLTERLANCEKLEQFAELNVRNGIGLIQEQLVAKAARLSAQIALLRAQGSE